jgi:dihydrodipicolinate synthase/N-acetylneuraminate lyase
MGKPVIFLILSVYKPSRRLERPSMKLASRTPILVGTGTGSAKETVKLCNQAGDAGADYAIVIFPGEC